MERTVVIIKPDGVERKLVGKVIQRFEEKGLEIKQLEHRLLTKEILQAHYHHLKDQPFFPKLINYMTRGPVVLMVIAGENVIQIVRKLVGKTDPFEAAVGTIRSEYGHSKTENLVHASDSIVAAQNEIERFFPHKDDKTSE